jgi:hypothetical protein
MDAYEMAKAAGAFGVADELERLKVEYAAAIERGMLATADLQGQLAGEKRDLAETYQRLVETREQIAERDVALDKAVLRAAELEAALDWVALYVETYRRGDKWQSDIRDRARAALRGEGEKP